MRGRFLTGVFGIVSVLHKNWEAASEEQKARIQQLKAQADKIGRENGNENQEDGQLCTDITII